MSKIAFTHKPDHITLTKWCINYWNDIDIYEQWQNRSQEFILHDGPPYANGDIHLGHAVNKTLKDIVNRFMAMKGKKINYILGWDCNGLPIEAKVESMFAAKGYKMHQINVEEFRKECAQFAKYWIDVQKSSFERMGVIADKKQIYTTIDKNNQLDIIKLIHKFATNDLIYRNMKPVMWSCHESTALAESEVEYAMKRSTAIDLALQITYSPIDILNKNGYIPIWTTTPWTLPANRAVAYGNDIVYSILSTNDDKKFVVAEDLVKEFTVRTGLELQVIDRILGKNLFGTICLHPLYEFGFPLKSPLVHGDHVTTAQGTGLVHIAPDYGEDDFNIAKRENIPCCNYITDTGHFIDSLPRYLAHRFYADVELDIINMLNEVDLILSASKIEHSYPHSWRSGKPLIQRATYQWFIDIDTKGLRERCIEAIKGVKWLPENGYDRFMPMLLGRDVWCISRQRIWGTPIAMFYLPDTGELLIDRQILDKTIKYLDKFGISAWWSSNAEEYILGDSYPDYKKINDIVDVWFESGATQDFILRKLNKYPADMYLEGCDQYRAWFQSSLMVSCVEEPIAPYKCIKTHGYVVDNNGRKMSKSLGNGQSPQEIIEKFGPDVLRLWVARQDSAQDLTWSNNQMIDVEKMQNKFRNTIKFLITNGKPHSFEYDSLQILEKWILYRISELQNLVNKIDEEWNIQTFVMKLYYFCEHDLSRLYFDMRKDVLYWENDNNTLKQQVQSCLYTALEHCIRWIAPIMPFMAEEAWKAIGNDSSIHINEFLESDPKWNNSNILYLAEFLLKMRKLINSKIEPMRENKEIKTSLDAHLHIACPKNHLLMKSDIQNTLQAVAIVSKVTVEIQEVDAVFNEDDTDNITISVTAADGYKCIKCKRRVAQIFNEICTRCSTIIE